MVPRNSNPFDSVVWNVGSEEDSEAVDTISHPRPSSPRLPRLPRLPQLPQLPHHPYDPLTEASDEAFTDIDLPNYEEPVNRSDISSEEGVSELDDSIVGIHNPLYPI